MLKAFAFSALACLLLPLIFGLLTFYGQGVTNVSAVQWIILAFLSFTLGETYLGFILVAYFVINLALFLIPTSGRVWLGIALRGILSISSLAILLFLLEWLWPPWEFSYIFVPEGQRAYLLLASAALSVLVCALIKALLARLDTVLGKPRRYYLLALIPALTIALIAYPIIHPDITGFLEVHSSTGISYPHYLAWVLGDAFSSPAFSNFFFIATAILALLWYSLDKLYWLRAPLVIGLAILFWGSLGFIGISDVMQPKIQSLLLAIVIGYVLVEVLLAVSAMLIRLSSRHPVADLRESAIVTDEVSDREKRDHHRNH